MSDEKIDVLAVMDSVIQRSGHVVACDVVAARAAVAELIEAAEAFRKAEWMVTHDWGGDRETVANRLDDALARVRSS